MLGPIITSVPNTELSEKDRELLENPMIGGVILFSENFINQEQLRILVQSIKKIKEPELLVFVDQEGGRIQRFSNDFFPLPSHQDLGRIYDLSMNSAIRSAELTGFVMAAELISQGIDLSFSPVVDINHGLSEVISDRSFHSDPSVVSLMAGSYIKGMSSAGMKAVAKHFPGHGAVIADSHTEQPIDTRPAVEIEKDIKPYLDLIDSGLPGIMTAHIVYPSIDERIATFSNIWLKTRLREKYSYDGLIFSDDLTMQSAVEIGSMQERIKLALDAGCDFILWCHPDESIYSVLSELSVDVIDKSESYQRIRPSKDLFNQKTLEKGIQELNSLLNMK